LTFPAEKVNNKYETQEYYGNDEERKWADFLRRGLFYYDHNKFTRNWRRYRVNLCWNFIQLLIQFTPILSYKMYGY